MNAAEKSKSGSGLEDDICKPRKFTGSRDSDSDISDGNENQSRALVFRQRKNLRIIRLVDLGAAVARITSKPTPSIDKTGGPAFPRFSVTGLYPDMSKSTRMTHC
jgi:hypothetical protein